MEYYIFQFEICQAKIMPKWYNFFMICERLKDLRLEKGLKQSDVAKALHLKQDTIARYELGLREPNNQILVALCDYFDVSADYLLGRTDDYK